MSILASTYSKESRQGKAVGALQGESERATHEVVQWEPAESDCERARASGGKSGHSVMLPTATH